MLIHFAILRIFLEGQKGLKGLNLMIRTGMI
jgi:hypothetical protein